MRGIVASILVLVLCGCASDVKQPVPLYEVIKKGDRLTVAKPIKREPTRDYIYFQKGKAHSWWGADVWRTLCKLRVDDSVESEALFGSVYEVSKVRRTSEQIEDTAEQAGITLSLRTISGAPAEDLRCVRWHNLESATIPSDITLEDFEDAVNGYLKIVDGEAEPQSKEIKPPSP